MRRAVALLTLCASIATAQVTRTETQSVLVDVLVTDKKNNPIHGLTERDFQVFEDGKEQKVDGLFTEASNSAPAQSSLILLFDNAGMTQREQAYARQTATSLLDQFAATGASIVQVNRGGAAFVAPSPLMRFHAGDEVLVVGAPEQVAAAREFLI